MKRKPDAEMFRIVRECLAGSREARATLWNQIEEQIVKHCYLPCLGRLARDEDARREVFLRVMADLDPVQTDSASSDDQRSEPLPLELLVQEEGTVKFWTWIFTLATWRAIDVVRAHDQQIGSRQEHRWITELSLEVRVSSEGDDEYTDRPLPAHDEWVDKFDAMTWSEVMRQINNYAGDRVAVSAFVQFYIVGLSWRKIATGFAMTPDTVRMRVMRMIEDVKLRLFPEAVRVENRRRRRARGTGIE